MAVVLEKICRTCLSSNSSVLLSIFDKEETILKMFQSLDLSIVPEEQLPTKICLQCLAELNKAFSFQKRAKRSEQTLRGHLRTQQLDNENQQNLTIDTVPSDKCPYIESDCRKNLSLQSIVCFKSEKNEAIIQLEKKEDLPNLSNLKSGSDRTCKVCGISFVRRNFFENHVTQYHPTIGEDQLKYEENLEIGITESTPLQITAASLMPSRCIRTDVELRESSVSDTQFKCTRCNAFFALQKSLKIHLRNGKCTEVKYPCTLCQRVFDQKRNLQRHMMHHYKAFKCMQATCQESFDTQEELKEHSVKNHTNKKKYCCQFCAKEFNMSSTLKDHIRTHTNEKPFLCSLCGKGFSQSTNMKQHVLRHTKIKMFKCGYGACTSSFVSKGELNSHSRTHTGDHPFICDVCNSGFTTASSLAKHKRIHTGERPYACDLCPMRFTALGTLKNHRRTHTGEKPFACDYCDRAFAQNSDLVAHRRTHTGDRPYKCTICNLSFQHNNVLKKHFKSHKETKKVDQEMAIKSNIDKT